MRVFLIGHGINIDIKATALAIYRCEEPIGLCAEVISITKAEATIEALTALAIEHKASIVVLSSLSEEDADKALKNAMKIMEPTPLAAQRIALEMEDLNLSYANEFKKPSYKGHETPYKYHK